MRRRMMMTEQSPAIDWSQEPFCIEVLDGTEFTVTYTGPDSYADFYYRPRGGDSWMLESLTKGTATTFDMLEPNTRYQVRVVGYESGTAPSSNGLCRISSSYNFNVSGNIMSLIGNNFTSLTSISNTYQFYYLFYGASKLLSAENLVLPAMTLAGNCYRGMFQSCTALTTAPELPATSLASYCYTGMFYGCRALTVAPELPAMTLSAYCYASMFYGCSSLTATPSLPATAIAEHCYTSMFYNCTNLTTVPSILPATTMDWTSGYECYRGMFSNCSNITAAPELPIRTLNSYGSYYLMFSGCSKLNYVKCLATTINDSMSTYYWLENVAATGTFVKHPDMTGWTLNSASGIPTGWTVQDAISFTIGSQTYSGYSGMTWQQWVESDYNTDGYFVSSGYVFTQDYYIVGTSQTTVSPTDTITSGGAYTLYNS